MERLLIDTLGTGLGIYVTLTLYEAVWVRKKLKLYVFASGVMLVAIVLVVLTTFLQNVLVLPLLSLAFIFTLSLFYNSGITYRILLSLAVAAIIFVAEMLIGFILVQMLMIPLEQVQTNMATYMFGVLSSNLLALFLVFSIKIFLKGSKQEAGVQFNLLMATMPIQSIILCFIVFENSIRTDTHNNSPFGIAAVFLSLSLIFITMIILSKQRKAMSYKSKYDLGQARLKLQIEHYQDIYNEQREMKSVRHEISNNLIAISGMLKAGQVQESIARISSMQKQVERTADIVDTGLPAIDAILSAKITEANDSGIDVTYTVIIEDELYIDQFDIAVIIANALDNAIEGTLRSDGIDKTITLGISSVVDYISIQVENYATDPIYEDFRTSKPDKKNHGFGMQQMRDVVHKYNGSFRPSFDSNAGCFSLKVMLNNKRM